MNGRLRLSMATDRIKATALWELCRVEEAPGERICLILELVAALVRNP
jgi:hypothetical protein